MIEVIPNIRDLNAPVRKWQRLKIDLRVKMWRSEKSDDAIVGRTCVMSEGGLSVYVPKSIEIGTNVLVEFSLPGTARELWLPALIRNHCGFRCGMEFMKAAMADRELIRRYLQSRVSENDEFMKKTEACGGPSMYCREIGSVSYSESKLMEPGLSDSQVTVTAEVFAQKLKQKYPQRAAALGDHLIAAFVKDHPQYRVTYDGNTAVSISWHRTPASTTAASSTTASALAPDPRIGAIDTQSEQRLKSVELSSETCSGHARDLPMSHDDSGCESRVRTVNERKHLRVPCKGKRAYIISDNVPGVVVDVVEISRGGLRFLSFEQFDQQAVVSVAIHYIAGGQNTFQDGLIVRAWHERTGMLPNEYAVKFSL